MRAPPLPLVAVAFAAGIAFAGTYVLPAGPLLAPAVAAALLALWARRAAPRLALAAGCTLALALGAFWEASDRSHHPNALAPWLGRRVEVIGRVEEEARPRNPEGWRTLLRVTEVRDGEAAVPVDARLLLSTGPDVRPAPGAPISATGSLRPIHGDGNFGAFDYGRYAAHQHLYASLYAHDPFVRQVGPSELRPEMRLALTLRERLAAVHHASLPPDDAALLNSLVLGSRAAPVPQDVEESFRRAGVVHVLVASGTQVSLLACWLILRRRRYLARLPGGRWTVAALAVGAAWLYALVAGGGPSVGRAALMVSLLALAMLAGREPDLMALLSWAAIAILAARPSALFDIGFQLSFAATWGIIALEPWFRGHLTTAVAAAAARGGLIARLALLALHQKPDQPPRLRSGLWVLSGSLAAQLATAPLLAYYYCQVVWIGLVANPVAVPLAAGLVPSGLIASCAGIAWPAAGQAIDVLCREALVILRAYVGWCARVPGGHLWIVPPSAFQVGLCFAGLALLPHLRREHLGHLRCHPRACLAGAGLAVLFLGWHSGAPRPPLRVTFLDVGQGDSILVQAPSGAAFLVDGGGSPEPGAFDVGERVLIPALLRRGVRRLDYVLLSHPHADHAGGLVTLCRELPVGALLDAGGPPGEAEALFGTVASRGIPRLRSCAPAAWQLDEQTRLALLHPGNDWQSEPNSSSVVLRLDCGRVSFLLTGDIEQDAEDALLRAGTPLRCDVLKVPHHGSGTSSTPAFLAAAAPRLVVVSVGLGNRSGLPDEETIRRLAATGALLYRTDQDGAVEVVTNGEALAVRSARSDRWVTISGARAPDGSGVLP